MFYIYYIGGFSKKNEQQTMRTMPQPKRSRTTKQKHRTMRRLPTRQRTRHR